MTARWTNEKAWEWYRKQPWLTGCNFIPSTAINQIEMFSEGTFDPETIDRELGWAAQIGFNTTRTYLHNLCWRDDAEGFLSRVDQYLDIASKHGIRTLITIFDDCWHEPKLGTQPEPVPGVHNSGWARSPGREMLLDRSNWNELEAYVKALAVHLKDDERVLGWDIYNEVTNLALPSMSLSDADRKAAIEQIEAERAAQNAAARDLMVKTAEWLRACEVTQPLTAGLYFNLPELNDQLIELSDVISFHHYRDAESLERLITKLKAHNRPLLCTEYLNRRENCDFESHMRVFQREKIACYNWGLVDGKTQTKWAWSDQAGGDEPSVWFHDIFRSDGTAYRNEEVALIKSLRKTVNAR